MIRVTRKLPKNFIEEHLAFFEPILQIDLPDPGYKYFSTPILLLSNGMVVNWLKVEKQSLLYDTRLPEIGGRIFLVKFFIKALVQNKISFLQAGDDYVTIINEWSNNYFHWFTEALPKLVTLMDSGIKPIVLLPFNYNYPFQLRSLELLGVSHQVYKSYVLVGKKIYLPNRLAPYPAHYNPTVMKRLSSLLSISSKKDVNKGRRIYISRVNASKRKIQNESEVITLMKEFNFCILELESFTLDDQISIMQHTDILVSIHGAGLTNIIFCKPGTNVLELSLQNEIMDKCYFNLANAMDLNYYYQFCHSSDTSANYHTSNLIVNVQLLRENLNQIILNNDV